LCPLDSGPFPCPISRLLFSCATEAEGIFLSGFMTPVFHPLLLRPMSPSMRIADDCFLYLFPFPCGVCSPPILRLVTQAGEAHDPYGGHTLALTLPPFSIFCIYGFPPSKVLRLFLFVAYAGLRYRDATLSLPAPCAAIFRRHYFTPAPLPLQVNLAPSMALSVSTASCYVFSSVESYVEPPDRIFLS